jgi:uncharacterized iron-regulated membrane protein
MNRKIHRWVSFPIAIFLLLIAATGLLLQFEELTEEEGDERPVAAAQAIAMPGDAAGSLVTQALAAAQATRPDFQVKQVNLSWAGGSPSVTLMKGERRDEASMTYDPATQKATYVPAEPESFHRLLIGLHTGKIAGGAGIAISLLAGLILAILSVTGLLVYLDMWKRRRAAGKTGMFWK